MAIDILPNYTTQPLPTGGTKEDEFHGTEGNYLLPHHEEEIKRLQRQHEFIRSSTNGVLTSLSLPKNARVLDSGCADGTWLADLGQLDRSSEGLGLHGIDLSGALFRSDSRLDLRQHDLRLPFPDAWQWRESFDLVHQRLLVWGIGTEEWDGVVERLVSLVKPGGYIQLVEAEWVLPEYGPDQVQQRKLGKVQEWSTASSGMDVHVWRRLGGLLTQKGMVDVQVENFNLGYGKTATRSEDRIWTAELLPQSFRHLARKIPQGGIPDVADNAEEYMVFLEELVKEMKEIGYNPQLKWITARKPQ